MYEIKFKSDNKYNGEYGPVIFVNGVASTDNEWVASWFEGNSFNVAKQVEKGLEKLTVEQLKELATEKGLEFDSKIKKADLVEIIEGGE